MTNRFYLFIRGIRGKPNEVGDFAGNAETYVDNNFPNYKANTIPYSAGALTRRITQESNVSKVRTILFGVSDCGVYLCGHSNGCDLIERYIRTSTKRIEALHLIAGASEEDFRKNGFNNALSSNKVGKIYVYWSRNDKALQFASKTRPFLSWMGLGYGSLGLVGPRYVSPAVKERVISEEWDCDHNEYFNAKNFPKIMQDVTRL